MRFCDIPGHESVKERLTAMVDTGRLPHALLLQGPQGVGKTMLARALAQYIQCPNRHDGDSCGECPSCRQMESMSHIDTSYSYPVLKKKGGGPTVSDDYVDLWKRFVNDDPYMDPAKWQAMLGNVNGHPVIYVDEAAALMRKLSFTSHGAAYKVAIIWLPEAFVESSANKMLKLIEEPFGDTRLLLVSNSPKDILPTIYSRLQRVDVKPLPESVVAHHLVSRCGLDEVDAKAVANLAGGSITKAERQIELSGAQRKYFDLFIRLMRMAYQRDVAGLRRWSLEVDELGREGVVRFMEYASRLTRENFIYNLSMPQLNYLNREEGEFSKNFARFVNERNAIDIIAEIDSVITDTRGNAQTKIVLFDFAVKMIILIKR